MSNRFEIISSSISEVSDEISIDEHLDSIKESRLRIRSLASMLLGVCGMLLSACFLIIFFLLKEKPDGLPSVVFILLFSTVGLLLCTLISVIFSSYVRTPLPAATKEARLMNQITIYRSEFRSAQISLVLFVASILCFSLSLGVFAAWIL